MDQGCVVDGTALFPVGAESAVGHAAEVAGDFADDDVGVVAVKEMSYRRRRASGAMS